LLYNIGVGERDGAAQPVLATTAAEDLGPARERTPRLGHIKRSPR
jgi:hypothetical protein